MKTALLVVDMQNALIEEGPYACECVVTNIKRLIELSRKNGIEVIFVQHEEAGSELERGTAGWRIYHELAPEPNEVVIGKQFNSCFRRTELKAYLERKGIETLIVTGMQTEYCIDTSCKVAFEFGYHLIIPEMTHTTFDNALFKAEDIYKHYNNNIFKDRFGIVESLDRTIDRIEGRLGWR